MNNFDRELDWNDAISRDGGEIPPDGDYDFVVKSMERGRHNGSDKLPPCSKAVLVLEVTSPTFTGTVTHNLFLHTRTEGLLCSFFTAIGQRRKGETLQMNWNRVVGAGGRLKMGTRTYQKDGETKTYAEVKTFYEPEQRQAYTQPSFEPGRF